MLAPAGMAVAIKQRRWRCPCGKEKTMEQQQKTSQPSTGQANDTRVAGNAESRTGAESKLDKVLQQPLRPQEHAVKTSDNAGCCGCGQAGAHAQEKTFP